MRTTSATESAPAVTLYRRLGFGTATSVIVANMIGTGIFTTTGLLLAQLESGWMVMLCWAVGGLVALSGALSYAELATMMPRAGGEYVYLSETYGPWAGFLTGWTSFFVGFSAPIAATGVAVSLYLTAAGVLPDSWLAQKTIALGVMALFSAVHYVGLRAGAHVQNALTALKLLLLGGLLAVGFAFGNGSWSFLEAGSVFWSPGNVSGLGVAMLLVMFAYSGWNASAYLAEEVRDPARTLPRSLLAGTLTVMVLYLLVNLLFFYAAPVPALSGQEAVGEVAAKGLFGEGAARWLGLMIAVALLSSLSAYILIGPRVYFGMARDALFFRFAAQVHPRFGTPSASIVAQGICAGVMILTGTFEQLLVYIGFALGIFPWMTVASVLVLRRRQPDRERPYRVWGYPLLPLFYLAVSTTIMVFAFVGRPWPSSIAILTVLAGIPFYYAAVANRRRQRV